MLGVIRTAGKATIIGCRLGGAVVAPVVAAVVAASVAAAVLVACGSSGGGVPTDKTVSSTPLTTATLGQLSINVTMDQFGSVCSAVKGDFGVCLRTAKPLGSGVLDARLDTTASGPSLVRVLLDTASKVDGLDPNQTRIHIDAGRDLVLATSSSKAVCFTFTKADGTSAKASVHRTATVNDPGPVTDPPNCA